MDCHSHLALKALALNPDHSVTGPTIHIDAVLSLPRSSISLCVWDIVYFTKHSHCQLFELLPKHWRLEKLRDLSNYYPLRPQVDLNRFYATLCFTDPCYCIRHCHVYPIWPPTSYRVKTLS